MVMGSILRVLPSHVDNPVGLSLMPYCRGQHWLSGCDSFSCSSTSAGRKNGQDARWLQQVRRSGTTSDKVAALTLLLQESAVANLRSLDALLNWVIKRKGGRNVVAQVSVALCPHTSRKSR